MAHTPGPWKAAAHNNDVLILQTERMDDGLDYDYHVATAHDRDADGEANARLIAAAPDLLAALEDLVAGGYEDSDVPPSLLSVIYTAHAAIAKAKLAHVCPCRCHQGRIGICRGVR